MNFIRNHKILKAFGVAKVYAEKKSKERDDKEIATQKDFNLF